MVGITGKTLVMWEGRFLLGSRSVRQKRAASSWVIRSSTVSIIVESLAPT